MDYNNMINVFNVRDEDVYQLCTFKNILGHRNKGRSYELQILCYTENKIWETLNEINILGYMSVVEYINSKGLTSLPRCK